jgi:antitoxin CptB
MTTPAEPSADAQSDLAGPQPLGKLRWRCRRGMKELDVLLTRYADEEYARAAPAHQAAFRQLLDLQDPVIHAYCLGGEPAPTAVLAALIERITTGTPNDR